MIKLIKGNEAPNFKSVDQHGKPISLSDFKGKRLVLYFYPKDLTPGCTTQSCNLRDNYGDLIAKGFEVVGVSADNEAKHLKFIDKHDLPFRLIADTDKTVIEAFGVWGPKKFMGKEYDGIHRTTFVIDEKGIIEAVIPKVKTKEHAAQILSVLEEK